ncbi:MAG: tetratricopeptide repeat protein, partial [Phormidesmis sp.]
AHPYVATSLYNLGALYQNKGDYSQAKELYVQALAIALPTLGSEHPRTKSIQSWLDSLPPGT